MFYKSVLFTGVAFIASATAALADTTVRQVDISTLVPHCDESVYSLIVSDVACKASGCTASTDNSQMSRLAAFAAMANGQGPQPDITHLGQGMSSALVTALKATNCFKVMDRASIEELKSEADLTGVPFKPQPSDFLISGAITAADLTTKTSAIGGGFIPVVGAMKNTKRKAELSIDIRIIDVKSSEVNESKTLDVTSEKSSWALGAAGFGTTGAMFGGMSSTQSPELDSVANESVIEAANFITLKLAAGKITTMPSPPAPSGH